MTTSSARLRHGQTLLEMDELSNASSDSTVHLVLEGFSNAFYVFRIQQLRMMKILIVISCGTLLFSICTFVVMMFWISSHPLQPH